MQNVKFCRTAHLLFWLNPWGEQTYFLVFLFIAENFVKFNNKDESCGLRQYLYFGGVRCSR